MANASRSTPMTHLLESCRVAPPHGAVEELWLPLTFFDLNWLHFHPIRRLLFYEIPCSKEYFLETVAPKLKGSLSTALKHYFPLAGSLAFPLDTEKRKPFIRVMPDDSVSFTVVESDGEFDDIVGNHPRDADLFYDFIPQPPLISHESDYKLLPVLGIQVTLFPGRGMCIGLTNDHVAGDANSIVGFIRTWADICKHEGDEYMITESKSLPLFDRSVIKEPPGANSFYWNEMKQTPLQSSPFPVPTNRVRATYVLEQSQIKKFKDMLLARKPGLVHISSFVVTAAYVWSCLAKSLLAGEEEEVDGDAEEFFLFAVEARSRLDPPVPENYFGNCLAHGMGRTQHREVTGDEGFFKAGEAIGMEIQNRVNDNKKLMAGVENWKADISAAVQKRILAVSGSTRVDLYSVDFGWGKTQKLEMLSIDGEKYAMSLCKSRDCKGGLEIGLSLPEVVMDAFAADFADGLKG